MRLLWGNPAALSIWQAASLDELLSRDLSNAPPHVLTRMKALVDQLRANETVVEQWTLYPRGVPTSSQLYLSPLYLPDGQMVVLTQGIVSNVDPFLLRGAEVLRHTNVLVALLAAEGRILIQNPAAQALFGARPSWFEWFVDAAEPKTLVVQALAGERIYRELWAETALGRRCLGVELHAVLDPVSGQQVLLAHHTDETARVNVLTDLKQTLAVVKEQRTQILSLSAPIIELGNSIIAVPVIGPLDSERSTEIASRLLSAIVERRAKRVILDLTGSIASDNQGGHGLLRILRAIQFIGSKPALSGLHPDLSRNLIESGLDELGVPSFPTLAHALAAFTAASANPGAAQKKAF